MSRIRKALHNELQAIEFVRDELKLQSHLFKAEMHKSWQELEARWDELREHLSRAKTAAADAEPEIQTAASLLIETLKNGYSRLKQALNA